MSTISQKDRDRLAKLIRLLGSDADGEVLSAARAIRNVLAAGKHDLHRLADLVSGCPTWGRISDRERAAWLRVLLAEPRLSDAEHAQVQALRHPSVFGPPRDDVRVFNRWVTRLHARGIRP